MTSFFSSFNIIDLIIFSGLITCILLGVIRGFTNDLLGMMTWVGAIFVTSLSFQSVQNLARSYIDQPLFADLTALLLLFLGTLIILVFIAKSISKAVQKSVLSGLDRSLGILSGTLRGLIILTLVFMMSLLFWHPGETPEDFENSKFSSVLTLSSRFFYKHIIPQDLFPKRIIDHLYGPNRLDHSEFSADDLVDSLSNPQAGIKESPKPAHTKQSTTKKPQEDHSSTPDRTALNALVKQVQ